MRGDGNEFVANAERFLDGLLLRRHVSRDGRGADDPTGLVLDGRDGHGDIDDLAGLAPAPGQVVLDALAVSEPGQDRR